MTDLHSARLLETAVETLRGEILPTVDDPSVRVKIDHVTRLLWEVSARLSRREEDLRTLVGRLSNLVPVAPPAPADDLGALELLRASAEALVVERLPDWCADTGGAGGAALHELVEVERAFYIAQDPDVARGSAVVYRGGRIETGRASTPRTAFPEITAASLTDYVRAHFARDSVSASEVRRIPGGFSKETIFFVLTDERDGTTQDLVIRKDLPVPLIEKTVVREFPLLRKLHARSFPVAEPLWLEADRALFGGSFLVSRRVAGTNDVATWASDPARARAACGELARILATLHGYDPVSLGIDPATAALSAGEHVVREIDHWIDLFHRKRGEAFPLQELPLVWLRANVPPALFDRPARVLHGDVGFHNLMFDDAGTVTALLDWEFSVLGDPTQDLCFVRQFVEPMMAWDDFLGLYREAGGAQPCEDAGFFYDLWTRTRNAVGCVDAMTLFDNHMPTEMRFALAGHVFAPYMFVDQCEALLRHLAEPALA